MPKASKAKVGVGGTLYPSVAVSDTFNAICHGAAAYKSFSVDPTGTAWAGFATVALAATIGVLRFGISERRFKDANDKLATLSAYMGLPLVGLSFLVRMLSLPVWLTQGPAAAAAGACLAAIANSLTEPANELSKVLVNLVLFM
eukprot:gene6243-6065_t